MCQSHLVGTRESKYNNHRPTPAQQLIDYAIDVAIRSRAVHRERDNLTRANSNNTTRDGSKVSGSALLFGDITLVVSAIRIGAGKIYNLTTNP